MATEKLSPEAFPAKAKPKRVALYCRVSTGDQHLETQVFDLREFARRRGFEIGNEYTDTISGAKSKRPALDQLLADARRNRFEIVIVAAFDRLARNVRHFLGSAGRVQSSRHYVHQPSRKHRHGWSVGTGYGGHCRCDCGIGKKFDCRAGSSRDAQSEIGRPANWPCAP